MSTTSGPREVRAPRGTSLTCKGWQQEAALRMLMNNLDPEVAERPEDLVVYGGTGRAARTWAAFDAIVRDAARARGTTRRCWCSRASRSASFSTHEWAPRVLIANCNLVPDWATWEEFRRLEALGPDDVRPDDGGLLDLHRHAGHPAGHLRDVRRDRARQHFGGTLAGTLVVTGGLGGMGGAQPLAATMNGGVVLGVEVDPTRIERRLKTPATSTSCVDDARRGAASGARRRASDARPLSIGLVGNAADVVPELVAATGRPIDSSPTRRPPTIRSRLRPAGRCRSPRRPSLRARDPASYTARALSVDGGARRGDARRSSDAGAEVFDYGNNLRGRGRARRVRPRVRRIRASSPRTSGRCSARARGRSAGRRCRATRPTSPRPTARCSRCSPDDEPLRALDPAWPASGSPSRACPRASAGWATASAHRLGLRFNELVARGEVQAPIVIGRDHLDAGSVASPNRETEAMNDGSDAIADWPILNALVNTASGATWVCIHHGGGVGIGYSIHAGMVVVADGTELAAPKARARADQRSRDGRDPPRRRRLRARPRTWRAERGVHIPMAEA